MCSGVTSPDPEKIGVIGNFVWTGHVCQVNYYPNFREVDTVLTRCIRAAPVKARPRRTAKRRLLQPQSPSAKDGLELLAGRADVHGGRAITGAARMLARSHVNQVPRSARNDDVRVESS